MSELPEMQRIVLILFGAHGPALTSAELRVLWGGPSGFEPYLEALVKARLVQPDSVAKAHPKYVLTKQGKRHARTLLKRLPKIRRAS